MNFDAMYSKLDEIKHIQPEIYKIWETYLQIKQKSFHDLSCELSLMVDAVKKNKIKMVTKPMKFIPFMRRSAVSLFKEVILHKAGILKP